MLRNLLLTFGIFITASMLVFAQSGALKGKVVDKETKEPIPFANIIVELGGTMIGGATSDFEGNYIIKPIPPGKYDVKSTYVGYKPMMVKGMVIGADQIRFFDIEMESTAIAIEEFVVTEYEIPLIDKDQTQSGGTITSEEITKMPNRSVNAIASTVGGVFSADGGVSNVRGARSDQTVTYIDGIRVLGSNSLPQSAIEQVSVVLGGVPAQYGDARGGIINVTTKGASRKFGAGIELETSQFLDSYGHNRLGFSAQGPLIKGKKEQETSLLGYFLAGDLTYNQDGRPTPSGLYYATDDVLTNLQNNPLRPSGVASGGTYRNSEFTRKSDLELLKTTQNTAQYGANLSMKIDVSTSQTTTLTFGGQYVYNYGNDYSYVHSMFNSDKNTLSIFYSWRAFGRFTQRFPTAQDSRSLIKNVYYSVQADYSRSHNKFMDPDHKDDLFKYGYLGNYITYKEATYQPGSEIVDGQVYSGVVLNSWDNDIAYFFNRAEYNPYIANYTDQIYSLFPGEVIRNEDDLQLKGGLLNGQGAPGVYGLWGAPGAIQTRYGESDNSQIGINASAAADIGNHEIKFGFQYEQRSQRGYDYNAAPLWTQMRGLTNFHILELDMDNPYIVEEDGVYQGIIKYPRKYDPNTQYVFDKNLRKKLGLPIDGLDFILVDSWNYDTKTIQYYDENGILRTINAGEDIFSIDMFSADELLWDGTYFANYFGYDYKGNKQTTRPSFDDFFTKTDDEGYFTRPIPAFEPIYMAGYVQDKFAFRDLIFNIGLRVDRFDANQPVLKDPYLFYPAYAVKEVQEFNGESIQHPGNMGEDFVVYVDNVSNPTQITGYRNEDTWYNSAGVEIQDPYVLDQGSGISPYLKDPNQGTVNSKAFEDYEPQWSVMPRISFSFPISDEALFFAHYDVLTQRPTSSIYNNPSTYYFINNLGGDINNPNLKPTKTIDYELGFQQKLNNSSSLRLTTFYREMRDDIQYFRFNGAYPRDYFSFNNIDFGTVKGLTITYDLRRTNNTRVSASYTLQFAEGTGSSTTTAQALINSGLPNLRTTNPLNWDRRHNFNLMLDYRFDEGSKYNGPTYNKKIKGTDEVRTVQILKNTGANFTLTGGSGIPYTAQENILAFNSGGTRILKGTLNGSRLPWQFKVDMRVDKDIKPNWGKEGKESTAYINVYLQVLNLFNTKNVMGVYPATGNPDDDGYLAAAEWQREINEQVDPLAYRELYAIRIDTPGNYSSPRQIRLGILLNF
ncbi:MAG: carboxypeptidase-like regulatory domain-containing protein [Bacteroidales bacterium]|nr:carboxypeptidase-like regulatory domain-containing protein [Bacteroidales bacterium]